MTEANLKADTPTGADEAAAGRPARGFGLRSALRGRRHLWGVGAVALMTAVLQGALGIQQFKQYYMGAYDLVIFDQAIRGYAHGHMPVSVLKDVHDAAQVIPGYGHTFSILGDHFSPILALAAPLYWIWNSPMVLLVAQALLFGAAVPSVWAFTRRAVAKVAPDRYAVRVAYLIAIAYGISWPLQMASQAGFHEVGFFVLLSAIMIERYQAGRIGVAVACALGLLLVKEDCGYVVAAFGLLLMFNRDRDRRRRLIGALLAVGGVGAAVAIERWWLPAFGGRPGFYWYYDQLGPNLPSALWKIVSDPVYAFDIASRPADKVHTLLLLLWPLLFCCLLSPLSVLAIPLLLERAFSSKPEHWRTDQHYNAFLAVILTTAAVDGAVRIWSLAIRWRDRRAPDRAGPLPRTAGRWALGWAGAVLLCAAVMVFQSPMPLGSVFFPNAWKANTFTTAANRAITEVPSDSGCVEADNDIAPHLSSRTRVLLLDAVPRGCPWVVLQTDTVSYPFSAPAVEQSRAQWLVADGYQLVFSSDQVFVYHHP